MLPCTYYTKHDWGSVLSWNNRKKNLSHGTETQNKTFNWSKLCLCEIMGMLMYVGGVHRNKYTCSGTVSILMFLDLCIIVQFMKKNPTGCNSVSKYYYSLFIWSSTFFGRHTAHHQEPKTALAASGFSYIEGCWTCGWWTLSGTVWQNLLVGTLSLICFFKNKQTNKQTNFWKLALFPFIGK
jgi:hypothetical protein